MNGGSALFHSILFYSIRLLRDTPMQAQAGAAFLSVHVPDGLSNEWFATMPRVFMCCVFLHLKVTFRDQADAVRAGGD